MDNKKVCLFGGTFDPIHNGHIIIAYKVLEKLNFDKIIFIPNGLPPHRENPDTDANMRYKMTEIAINGEKKFEVSDIEVKKKAVSYFIDTVKYYKEIYKDLYMLIGTDQANRFRTWYKWDEYFPLVKILVVKKLEPLYEILDFVYLDDIEEIKLSSSEIRKRLSENKSIVSMVPENVLNFIEETDLYAK